MRGPLWCLVFRGGPVVLVTGFWGRSSAGRAPALQAGGRRFEPVRLHGSVGVLVWFGLALSVARGLTLTVG